MLFIRFKNREDAALKLIPYLEKYKHEQGVVLAVPRGGVPIAYHIARHYNFPLELLMTKKIGYPGHPEYAIGAVSPEDHFVDERFDIPKSYIDEEVKKIRASLQERYKKFMGNRKPADLENKVVIIVDDGMATGHTILNSIAVLRKKNPKKIVIAVPVAPPEVVEKMKSLVDDVICIYTPENFIGVGLHYTDFSEVSDEEVIRLLSEANHFEDVA
jgi:predicted phosphoribosyltransferase